MRSCLNCSSYDFCHIPYLCHSLPFTQIEMDAMKSALASSQHAAADLAAAAIRHERALQEEKVRAAKASAEVPY